MQPLTISPLHWSRLPDLRQVPRLDDDLVCMGELRAVLPQHGRVERLALHLIHKHFELSADEVLVEHRDPAMREQWQYVESRGTAALHDAADDLDARGCHTARRVRLRI
jgi:hypothetical protein